MSNKMKRKVTVESSKDDEDQPKRPSVFERLGGNSQSSEGRRGETDEKCRIFMRTGKCAYGSLCKFKHDSHVVGISSRRPKTEKGTDGKDLRAKVKIKREEVKGKEPRTSSLSPKRKGSKRSSSRSRKGEHDGKIKSTVVVTRTKSPPSTQNFEASDSKKKLDANWEDDSDDWPMDAAQLDYKEELTLERKRQQLQRELELELQKEQLMNENVTITKTVSVSDSSSSSSSSDSGSISTSSSNSESSSEGETSDTSSSSSSSSSSSPPHHLPAKKKGKKVPERTDSAHKLKQKESLNRSKNNRSVKPKKVQSPSPVEIQGNRKGKEKRHASPASTKRRSSGKSVSRSVSNVKHMYKGPRTPSPSPVAPPRKQRPWGQSSSAESRSADLQRNRNKRHKKKKTLPRNEKFKSGRGPSPPPLSSPNRTALLTTPSKKGKSREEKSRHRRRDISPLLLPRPTTSSSAPPAKPPLNRHQEDKSQDRSRVEERNKVHSRKEVEETSKRPDSRERPNKRSRLSPLRRDVTKLSPSPRRDRYESGTLISKKGHSQVQEKDNRRKASVSPGRSDRRKGNIENDKKRDHKEVSPRERDNRRDPPYKANEGRGHEKRGIETKSKRAPSPEAKKGRDDRIREHVKDRNDHEPSSWQGENRRQNTSTRHSPEPRSRQEIRSQPSQRDRSRERDLDRKKRKDRDLPGRTIDDSDRGRLSPLRPQSPISALHSVRDIEPLSSTRSRLFDTDIPTSEPDYPYSYESLHDSYLSDRLLPSDYDTDILRSSVFGSDVYSESQYRRGGKDSLDRYESRDLSPRDVLPHRDIISLSARSDDYLQDLTVDDQNYEDRWSRGRAREDWDTYTSLPSAPLPPHVAAALDEDRYGRPRRRCTDSEWSRARNEDRDTPGLQPSHRLSGRSREGRSRSPSKSTYTYNRATWNERGNRHEVKNSENRPQEDNQKSSEDRKNRGVRKEPIKRKEETDSKISTSAKEKISSKRPRSPSPPSARAAKKKKNGSHFLDLMKYHGGGTSAKGSSDRKNKDDNKVENKSSQGSRNRKNTKQDMQSPKTEVTSKEASSKNSGDVKAKERDEKKTKKIAVEELVLAEEDFSDISDDDDELLNQEDFIEIQTNAETSKEKHKVADTEDAQKRKEKFSTKEIVQETKRNKDTRSQNSSSKEKFTEEALHSKDRFSNDLKEVDSHESLKEDTATDVEEYITAESVDYDPISDDELDALIEEPDDSLIKPTVDEEKSKIVDALDVDWSALVSQTKTGFVPGFARRRFKAAHVLQRIGFSQALAGSEFSKKIIKLCQQQLDEEKVQDKETLKPKNEKFEMQHHLAAFHVSISQNKRERVDLFNKVGPHRRALCARRDLQIRKLLCKPINTLTVSSNVTYTPQYTIVDKELYKQSLELLKLKKTPAAVNVC